MCVQHRPYLWLLVLALSLGGTGCKRSVPEDIVRKSLQSAMRTASGTASAMCGVPVRGFGSVQVSIKQRGEENKGVAHVSGKPLSMTVGSAPPSVKECEGDVEYAYSYTSKTSRSGRKRTTTVTWVLESLKLVAVQTPGVAFRPVTEAPPQEDDGEDDKAAPAKK